jgi:hypothetical protein
MILPQLGIDDMKSLVALLEALLDEGAQHPVLLVEAVEKSADVAVLAKHAARDMDWSFVASHLGPPRDRISAAQWGGTFQERRSYISRNYRVHPVESASGSKRHPNQPADAERDRGSRVANQHLP